MTTLADAADDYDVVHADILLFFPDLVRDMGGDPAALLADAGIDARLLDHAGPGIGYRPIVTLLERAASALACPDFGMRLAMRQGGGQVFGALGEVMRNSRTFGDALHYVRHHSQAHSLAAAIQISRREEGDGVLVSHNLLLDRLPHRAQLMEQIMLLGHLNAMEITGGRVRARAILFRHQPVSSPALYRRYFGCPVRFDQQDDATEFGEADLAAPIVDRDAGTYASVTAFIDRAFPAAAPPVHAQVRGLIQHRIGMEACSNASVAAALGLHPRTLHRRLKDEGTSFQAIKDEVRRDAALYYLHRTDMDLTHIAQRLGYAEHSVLTRSCTRWFAASPSAVRARATA